MKYYHGTNLYGLKETVKQGYLLHQRINKDLPNMSPCTYLAIDIDEARKYGDILLEVEYNPFKNEKLNNYCKDCWQFRVYEPIYNYKVIV